MHSWIWPLTALAMSTASRQRGEARIRGAADVRLVVRVGRREAVLEVPRSGAAAALATCRGVATQIQHLSSSSGVRASMTSSVLAIGGTRSGRAMEPISMDGTPSRSSSRTISTFCSVEQHAAGELQSVPEGDVPQLTAGLQVFILSPSPSSRSANRPRPASCRARVRALPWCRAPRSGPRFADRQGLVPR